MSKYKEIIILIIAIIAFYIIYSIGFLVLWSTDSEKPSNDYWHITYIKTKYNDNFAVYQKKAWDDPENEAKYLKIYYINNGKKVKIDDEMTGNYNCSGIKWEYKNDKVVAYVLDEAEILYRTRHDKQFKEIGLRDLSHSNPKRYKFLIPIARDVLKNGGMLTTEIVGGFLIKTNDKESFLIMKQYASGKFTNNQKSNADSYSLENDIKLFKSMLKERKDQL